MPTKPRRSKWRPSDKIAPLGTVHSVETQRLLEAVATRLLAKSGHYPRRTKREDSVAEAEMIGMNGRLRPTWVGKP